MLERTTLLRPLTYLYIKETLDKLGRKRNHLLHINFFIPSIICFCVFMYVCVNDKIMHPYINSSLFCSIKDFIQMLPGFYIASLAAIATFEKKSLDEELETSVYIREKRGVGFVPRTLTRRQFLCYLFGYLSFLCILLSIVHCIFSNDFIFTKEFAKEYICEIIKYFLGDKFGVDYVVTCIYECIDSCCFVAFVFLFSQLICITFLGLFYLSDRLHRREKFSMPKGRWLDGSEDGDNDKDKDGEGMI